MLQKVRDSLVDHLNKFNKRSVLVIGDLMVDEYIQGEVNRISPEAPVPIVKLDNEYTKFFGGAGNVFNNLVSLDCNVVGLVGLMGLGENGKFIEEHVESCNQSTEGLFTDNNRPTTTKTRIVSDGHQIVRLDREDSSLCPEGIKNLIYKHVYHSVNTYDVVIISDYEKGLLDKYLIEKIICACRAAGTPCFVDPKSKNFQYYKDVDLIMPNLKEAQDFTGIEICNEHDAYDAALSIKLKLDCESIILKMGEGGMLILGQHHMEPTYIPTNAKQVFDVTGAGDTAIATLALAYASGANIIRSAKIANAAAGYVVGQTGTTTIDRSKLGDEICKIKED